MNKLLNKLKQKKLESRYNRLLADAMALQRQGNIQAFASKSAEAESVYNQIQNLRTA